MQRRIPNRNGLKRSDPETIMTPTLQVPHSLSPYHKGDKRLCNCKWAIFNNIHNLHVLYSIAFLMRRFYALALGKPLEAGGGGPLSRMDTEHPWQTSLPVPSRAVWRLRLRD